MISVWLVCCDWWLATLGAPWGERVLLERHIISASDPERGLLSSVGDRQPLEGAQPNRL